MPAGDDGRTNEAGSGVDSDGSENCAAREKRGTAMELYMQGLFPKAVEYYESRRRRFWPTVSMIKHTQPQASEKKPIQASPEPPVPKAPKVKTVKKVKKVLKSEPKVEVAVPDSKLVPKPTEPAKPTEAPMDRQKLLPVGQADACQKPGDRSFHRRSMGCLAEKQRFTIRSAIFPANFKKIGKLLGTACDNPLVRGSRFLQSIGFKMKTSELLSGLSQHQRMRLESLLMEFEGTWSTDALQAELPQLRQEPDEAFLKIGVIELVKIDLQRSWTRGVRKTLEQYVQEIPELGQLNELPADLIAVEFLVRRPVDVGLTLDNYQSRFPDQFSEIPAAIRSYRQSSVLQQDGGDEVAGSTRFDRIGNSIYALESTSFPCSFGRYQLLRRLGSGAMGAVFLAKDPQLGRKVAIKIPSFRGGNLESMIERFYQEARSAAKVDHPNICKIYEVGEVDGCPFIAMSYIKGQTLSSYITEGKRPNDRRCARFIRKVARALATAHAGSIVHRDLKPENIMVVNEREPVVMDFGLARQIENDPSLTESGMILGTPAYMSPEQIDGTRESVGTQSDIYSLGVVMYELLSGQIPFRGNLASVLYKITHEDPVPLQRLRPDIRPALAKICEKMMRRNPARRYQTMQEAIADLDAFISSEPEKATWLSWPKLPSLLLRFRNRPDQSALETDRIFKTTIDQNNAVEPNAVEPNAPVARPVGRSRRMSSAKVFAMALLFLMMVAAAWGTVALYPLISESLDRQVAEQPAAKQPAQPKLPPGLVANQPVAQPSKEDDAEPTSTPTPNNLTTVQATAQNLVNTSNHSTPSMTPDVQKTLYHAQVRRAYRYYLDRNLDLAKSKLSETDSSLQGWEHAMIEKLWNRGFHQFSQGGRVVLFTPDGKYLAKPNRNDGMDLIDTATGKLQKSMPSHDSPSSPMVRFVNKVTDATISEDGKLLATVTDRDLNLMVSNIQTGQEVKRYPIQSPSLNTFLAGDASLSTLFLGSSYSQKTRVQAGPNMHRVRTYSDLDAQIVDTVRDIDRQFMVTKDSSSKLKWTSLSPPFTATKMVAPKHYVCGVAASKSDMIVWGSKDGTISFQSISKGLATGDTMKTFQAHSGWVTRLSLSQGPNPILISTSNSSEVRLWSLDNLTNDQPLRQIGESSLTPEKIYDVTISADGKYAACIDPRHCYLWPVDAMRRIDASGWKVADGLCAIAYSDQDATVVAIDNQGNLLQVDPHLGEVQPLSGQANKPIFHRKPVLSPSGSYMLSNTPDNREMNLYSIQKGTVTLDRTIHSPKHPTSISYPTPSFNANETKLGFSFADVTDEMVIFDIASGSLVSERIPGVTPKRGSAFQNTTDHLAMAIDDCQLQFANDHSGQFNKAGTTRMNRPNGVMQFSSNDQYLAIIASRDIHLHQQQEGKPLGYQLTRTLKGHSKEVRHLAFLPDQQRLFSGADDGTVRVWNTETGEEILTLQEWDTPVADLDVSADGRYLVAASSGGQVQVWDAGQAFAATTVLP